MQVCIDGITKSSISLDCVIFGLQRFGGISNYWARLIEHASESPAITGSLVLPKRVTFSEFDARWMVRMPTLRETLDSRISRYLRAPMAGTQDVFHTSYYRLPAGRTGKYVVSAYDFTYERYRRGLARWFHSTQKARSLERADAVLCISESTRRDILEFCPTVDAGKLHVVHLGVDRDMFFRDTAVESPASDCTVLFVGQRQGYKRFDLAVDALRQCPRLRLGVVGPPLERTERNMLHATLGTRWHEFGPVDTSKLRRLYSTAFAFIFPSDYEGFGLPVLEAMACGCPVVAAGRSSLPEVGGQAAHYAKGQRGDDYAIHLDALADTAVYGTAVQAGLARVHEFPWSATFDQTLAVYLDNP